MEEIPGSINLSLFPKGGNKGSPSVLGKIFQEYQVTSNAD